MDYGVYGVNCELCGPDSNHRSENCVALFHQRRPGLSTTTFEGAVDFSQTDPEFLALRARAEADEVRWAAMAAERRMVVAEVLKYFQPGVRRRGTRTVRDAASLGEMISILQRLPDVNDVCVRSLDTGGYRLETFQGARPQTDVAS